MTEAIAVSDTVDSNQAREALARLRAEVAKVVVGQDAIVSGMVIALLCRGHVLLEGVPGVAKTLLVRTLSLALDLSTKRLQFTPDLMPGDVTGSLIFDARTAAFQFREGPVFTNLLLADEINRTPPASTPATWSQPAWARWPAPRTWPPVAPPCRRSGSPTACSPTSSTCAAPPAPRPRSNWAPPRAAPPRSWPPPRRGPGCSAGTTSHPTTSRRWPGRPCGTGCGCGRKPSSKASPSTRCWTRYWRPCRRRDDHLAPGRGARRRRGGRPAAAGTRARGPARRRRGGAGLRAGLRPGGDAARRAPAPRGRPPGAARRHRRGHAHRHQHGGTATARR